MKILYFSYLYDLFGISIGSTIKAIELMKAMEKLGHEVKIYWRKSQPKQNQNNGSVIEQKKAKKIFAKFLHDPKQLLSNLKYIPEEYLILKRENPDILISRLDLYLFSSLLVSKFRKIPILIEADAPNVYEARTFHSEFKGIPKLAEYIEKKNLNDSNGAFCVSTAAKNHFISEREAPTTLKIITNGVDLSRFSASSGQKVRQQLGLENNIVVGFVGSFHYWHGVDNLINVVEKSVTTNQNLRFLFVGRGGPMEQVIRKALTEKRLDNNVLFTGLIENDKIPEYINAMDIVLAPYPNLDLFYYSPVKVYEYMACGKPVITTNIGQLSELIDNGTTGFLTEPNDVEVIVKILLSLSRDQDKRISVGKKAKVLIAQNHTWNHKAKELEEFCLNVFEKEGKSS